MPLVVMAWLAIVAPSDPTNTAPLSLAPRLDLRTSQAQQAPPAARFGPEPRPDFTGRHSEGEIKIEIREDGTAKVDVPRPFRAMGGMCLLGMCLTTQGVRKSPDRKRPIKFATAPPLFSLAVAFGRVPPSKSAAARLLAETSESRAQQNITWTRERLIDAERHLGQRLAEILHDRSVSEPRKHAIIRELWSDAKSTAMTPVAEEDELAAARASSARNIAATIERFAAMNMPQLSLRRLADGAHKRRE